MLDAFQALEQMVMPPSSSEYPTSAGPYSRQSQQQQSGPSPGMIPSPMQQANMASRNPLSPQPWPPQRQQQSQPQTPGHMSGPPTPQQQSMSAQQQMNGNMMSGGSMQEIAASQPGMPHHMGAGMESAEPHLSRPRSQDAQSAQQTVPDPSSEGDARRPDQSEFSLDKFVDNKEQAPEKQEDQDKPKASDSFSAPDFGPYQGDSSNSQPPKSDSESYQATPPPPVSAAASRPSSRAQAQSSNGMAANGPQGAMPPHPMGMGMPQMPPHGMPQGMSMGGPHGMPHSMHPSMGPGGMHMMGPPGHMMDMHGAPYMPPGPMGHQQEMAALQQQLQEFYCMPQQTQDIQAKVRNIFHHLKQHA
jgi:hypothetical protein